MMYTLLEVAIAAMIVIGGLFGLVGSWGMLRLRDSLQRLHAPTKATTIGVGTALLASNVELFILNGRFAWEEATITTFLLLTAPLSAVMLAKVHLWQNTSTMAVPPPVGGGSWGIWAKGETAGEAVSRVQDETEESKI